MNTKLNLFLFFLLICSSIFNCKNDDEETPLQDFTLSIIQDGSQLSHSWTEVNISEFERYIIVRSLEPIPANLDPFASFSFNSEINKVVHEETSKEISIWEEIVLSEERKLFYRVFIELSDRYIVSNEVEVNFDEKLIFNSLQNSNIDVYHHPDLKLIYFVDGDSLFAYDYESAEFIAETELFLGFDIEFFSIGKFNGEDELYLITDDPFLDDRIVILDATSLDLLEMINIGDKVIEAINTDREGLIILVDDSSSPIKILDRASGEILGSADCSCADIYNEKIDFASTSENILRLVFSTQVSAGGFLDLTFSDTWELLSESPISYFLSNPLPKVTYTSDKNYFIPNYNGTLFDAEGNIINSIYSPINDKGIGYDFVFLENESEMINLTNPALVNNAGTQTINKYTFPNFELIDSWDFENTFGLINNYQLFYDGETLLLSYFLFSSGGSQVVIIPLNL
ncbi:MAG: hypothetical protein AB8H03_20840 [Saprospiraceae bacterium]